MKADEVSGFLIVVADVGLGELVRLWGSCLLVLFDRARSSSIRAMPAISTISTRTCPSGGGRFSSE